MRLGSTTTHRRQIGSQPAPLLPVFFGKQRILHGLIGPFECRNQEEIPTSGREKNSLSSRQCTSSQSRRYHPPYSPDLAPSDYYLSSNLKKWLAWRTFYSNVEVELEIDSETLDINHYSKGVEVLKNRWTKCIELDGEHIE